MNSEKHTEWRCIQCGAVYGSHFPWCSSCWAQGQIVPVGRRLRAAVDYQPATSDARQLARMAWSSVEHATYPELKIGAGALMLVSGLPGAGKSSFACRLLDSIPGPVLLVAAEEGLSPSLSARLLRCAVKRADFSVITRASCDAVVERLRELHAVACVIDSVQEIAWQAAELRHVLGVVAGLTTLIATVQANKDGEPAGAMQIQHEADVVIAVESMRWRLVKSRYQDLGEAAGEVLPAPPTPKENAA